MDGANPANLMGFINDYVPGKIRVGRIDLMKNFSFFEVPEENVKQILKSFKGVFVEDRKLVVELADNNMPENKKYKGDKPKQDFNVSKKGKKRF
ncbi:DbpA RNA binding domain protein [anaerobic digester metagenome]